MGFGDWLRRELEKKKERDRIREMERKYERQTIREAELAEIGRRKGADKYREAKWREEQSRQEFATMQKRSRQWLEDQVPPALRRKRRDERW